MGAGRSDFHGHRAMSDAFRVLYARSLALRTRGRCAVRAALRSPSRDVRVSAPSISAHRPRRPPPKRPYARPSIAVRRCPSLRVRYPLSPASSTAAEAPYGRAWSPSHGVRVCASSIRAHRPGRPRPKRRSRMPGRSDCAAVPSCRAPLRPRSGAFHPSLRTTRPMSSGVNWPATNAAAAARQWNSRQLSKNRRGTPFLLGSAVSLHARVDDGRGAIRPTYFHRAVHVSLRFVTIE